MRKLINLSTIETQQFQAFGLERLYANAPFPWEFKRLLSNQSIEQCRGELGQRLENGSLHVPVDNSTKCQVDSLVYMINASPCWQVYVSHSSLSVHIPKVYKRLYVDTAFIFSTSMPLVTEVNCALCP